MLLGLALLGLGLYDAETQNLLFMYNVTIKHYENKKETSIPVASYHDALMIQEGASAIAGILNWTRHDNCQGVVRHMDMVHDLFNEGAITVNPVS